MASSVERSLRRMTHLSVRRVPNVSEEDIVPLLLAHDVLLLPYNTSGGYSGALNVAAPTGIQVISYDLPQIREQARALGIEVRFIRKGSATELAESIHECLAAARLGSRPTLEQMKGAVHVTAEAVMGLIGEARNDSDENGKALKLPS